MKRILTCRRTVVALFTNGGFFICAFLLKDRPDLMVDLLKGVAVPMSIIVGGVAAANAYEKKTNKQPTEASHPSIER